MTAARRLGSNRCFLAFLLCLAFLVLPTSVLAQALANLPNQSRLQREVGLAIDEVCGNLLNNIGGGDHDTARADQSNQGDLFRRCNDMIDTAEVIEGNPPATGNDSLDLTPGQLNEALNSVAHMQGAAIGKGMSEIGLVQVAMVSDRLYALRGGAEGVMIAGSLRDSDGNRISFHDYDLREDMGAAGATLPDGVGAYLNLRGSFGDRNGNSEELGFDYHDVGLTGGVDYRVNDKVVSGLSLGYTFADRIFDRNGGNVESNSLSLLAYTGYQTDKVLLEGDGVYLDGILGFTNHWVESRRNVLIPIGPAPMGGAMMADRRAEGDVEAREYLVSGNAGYQMRIADTGLSVGPVARFEYLHMDVDSFKESGANGLNLVYHADDIESLILNFGGEASYDLSTDFGVLTPQLRIEWAHQFEDDPRSITARYRFDSAAPGSRTQFHIRTKNPDRNYVDIGLSLAAQFADGLSGFLGYETLVGHDDFQAHVFTVGGRLEF